jgi:hypothetical protein
VDRRTCIDNTIGDLWQRGNKFGFDAMRLGAGKRGQRCLLVTNGFYEWKKLDEKGKKKQS